MGKRDELESGISAARREFLGRAGRAGLLALGAPALAGGWVAEAYGGDARLYAGGLYGVELDGRFAGFVRSFSGGGVVAEVMRDPAGPDLVQRKRLGKRRVEPITIETGLPMAAPFYEWIKSSVEPRPKFPRKNGAIVAFDQNRVERWRRNFFSAVIAGVEYPSCDAASKEPAGLTVTIAPEAVTMAPPTGAALPQQPPQKILLRSTFRLRIKGLEAATEQAYTYKIEPIAIRVASAVPAAIEVSNLVITLANSRIAPFYAWHEDFVVKGRSSPERELVGVLEYLSPDRGSVLLALNLFNLGILKVAPEAAGSKDAVARSRVEMYCQAVTADFRI